MSQCPQCGSAVEAGITFCQHCGANLAPAAEQTMIRPGGTGDRPAAPPAPPAPPTQQWGAPPPPAAQAPAPGAPQQQWGAPPPGYPQQGYGQPGQPQRGYAAAPAHAKVDITKVIGNPASWLSALTVAGAMLGTALVLSLVLGAIANSDDFAFGDFVWTSLMNVARTFGVDVIFSDGDAGASLGAMPTLITVATLGVGALLFRRGTARGTSFLAGGVGEAARVGLLTMLITLVLTIVVRIVHPEIGGDEAALSFAGAIFLTFLLTFTVLTLVAFLRRDWLPAQVAVVHDFAAAPLKGFGVLVAALPLLGLVYMLGTIISENDPLAGLIGVGDGPRDLAWIGTQVSMLPSLGLYVLGLGLFASFGIWYGGDSDEDPETERLADVTDSIHGLLWVSPLLSLAVVAVAVWFVIAKTGDKRRTLANVGVFAGLTLVIAPVLVRMANFHFARWNDDEKYTFTFGISGVGVTFMLLLAVLVIGLVLLLATGNLDLSKLQGMGQQQQQWGQPGQQQWAGQPGQQWGQQPQAGQQGQWQQQAAPQQPQAPVASQYPGWRWDAQAQQWVPDPSTAPPPQG